MTTTDSLTQSMMEVPAMDDSMEMASPYLGQGDDFDIDIDLMEDHASNMDSDMMGADEFSQPQDANDDAILDADMADEPSEGSMVDADNLVSEDNDIDVQSEEEPFEAEMTEGDQAENGAPEVPIIDVSDFHPATETTNGDSLNPPKEEEPALVEQPLPVVTEDPSAQVESAQVQSEALVPAQDKVDEQTEDQGHQVEPSISDDDELAGPPSETLDLAATHDDFEKQEPTAEANETVQPSAAKSNDSQEHLADNEALASAEIAQAPASTQGEVQSVLEVKQHGAGDAQSLHQETASHETLHPVKIIYQENEIALFPPLEGDSAETFFLHDEDVAYESVAQLLKALRQVLQGNVADNEVLIIDIDTLGIQMTEDSFHTSQVTLHQVVDLYLRLCRNDGANDPDALYLTLSSKRAFPAEIADLLDAANDGKSLSEIHPWDEYDEAEPASEVDHGHEHEAEEQEDEAYYTTEAEQKLSVAEDQLSEKPDDEQISAAPPSPPRQVQDSEAFSESHDFSAREEHDTSGPGVGVADEPRPLSAHSHLNEQDKAQEGQDQGQGDLHEENDEHYESEGQRSESTATVNAAPGETDVAEDARDEQTEEFDENTRGEDPDYDELGPDYYEDEELVIDHPVASHEASHEGESSSHTEGGDAEQQISQAPILDKQDENEPDKTPADAANLVEPFPNEETGKDDEQTASALDSEFQNAAEAKEQTPEPRDDLLGIAVDLMQTPAKDDEQDAFDHFDDLDYDEHEKEPAAPASVGSQDANQEFDENEFGDYDTNFDDTEAAEPGETGPSFAESQSNDNGTTKRSRDEEDDWDVENTTLDAKRRRPS
ncbi:unnamed protein product [Penicillium salamii]|uniref:Uncharacterized protein n=1 Tax=Penicillium salamii TaxID=1612424 RepID=A0A9W4JEM7_9EURO|nr:unnamed protein product [Penicillium salamii]CAG7981299.1 unnamed protein product [Penicillium salamii]CAG8016897.1 unnamed protein product [Penicillium salamii]CAG8026075.1 unnamed protein product [Penicillium salamii]CAG8074250.1 unnamed protein product [Penicillium salamii]